MVDHHDELGSMYRAVEYHSDGTLWIIGADYGKGVEQAFGCRGYDFYREFSVEDVATLVQMLGEPSGYDLLETVIRNFESTHELEGFAKEHGFPAGSRAGTATDRDAVHRHRGGPRRLVRHGELRGPA